MRPQYSCPAGTNAIRASLEYYRVPTCFRLRQHKKQSGKVLAQHEDAMQFVPGTASDHKIVNTAHMKIRKSRLASLGSRLLFSPLSPLLLLGCRSCRATAHLRSPHSSNAQRPPPSAHHHLAKPTLNEAPRSAYHPAPATPAPSTQRCDDEQ